MKNYVIGLLTALLGTAHVALANEDKITKGFYTMDAMGCMLFRECTDVKEVFPLTSHHNMRPRVTHQ